MADVKRNLDLLSPEKKRNAVKETIDFFAVERDEEIGLIAAEDILNHFLQTVGLELYNKGVADSANFLRERFEALELDMDSLLKK